MKEGCVKKNRLYTEPHISPAECSSLQNKGIIIRNIPFENVEKFKYLGVTVTNTNDIHEEIKRRINMGNARYCSLDKMLSSRLLSKKFKVNII